MALTKSFFDLCYTITGDARIRRRWVYAADAETAITKLQSRIGNLESAESRPNAEIRMEVASYPVIDSTIAGDDMFTVYKGKSIDDVLHRDDGIELYEDLQANPDSRLARLIRNQGIRLPRPHNRSRT